MTKNDQYIFVDGRYFIRARQESPDFKMKEANRGKVYGDLAKYLPEIGVSSIVLDPNMTFYSSIRQLEKQIPDYYQLCLCQLCYTRFEW